MPKKPKREPRKTVIVTQAVRPAVFTNEMASRGEAVIVPALSLVESSYDRPTKGPKVINQIPLLGGRPPGNFPNGSLLSFKHLLGCDTATRELQGCRVSVASIFEADQLHIEGENISARMLPLAAFEFRGITDEPEKVSWVHLLKRLEGLPSPPTNLGLVVDSHLRELFDFNARQNPLLDEYMLPYWVKLIYASAERGTTEYLVNRLLSLCDSEADRILSLIENGEIGPEGLQAVQRERYTHVRQWLANRRQAGWVYRIWP